MLDRIETLDIASAFHCDKRGTSISLRDERVPTISRNAYTATTSKAFRQREIKNLVYIHLTLEKRISAHQTLNLTVPQYTVLRSTEYSSTFLDKMYCRHILANYRSL
jgi:hypothetical protein